MTEEYSRYNNEEIMQNNLCDNRGFDSSAPNKSLDTLSILTDIKQLEGKTVILIDSDSYNNDLILYYTDDHSILVQDNTIRYGAGMHYIDAKYLTTIEQIYGMYEDDLVYWNIISMDESNELAANVKRENELKRKDENKQERYKEYLKLKDEFENEVYKTNNK